MSRVYRKAEGLYERKLDAIYLEYSEKLTEAIEELAQLLEILRSPETAETITKITELLDTDTILRSVEVIHEERKAESPLNPLQCYLDQVEYEENKLAETCEDNPFLKQLGKLFRYYGFLARGALDRLRTDCFSQLIAFRSVFNLQANTWINEAMVEPIRALLVELEGDDTCEKDDPIEQAE